MRRVFFAAALAVLCLCLAVPALGAAAPDPLPPVEDPAAQMSDKAPEPASGEAASLEPSGEATSEEPSEEFSPEPDEPAVPLMPGRYEGADGGVLSVKEDGACTYETMVSGTVNVVRSQRFPYSFPQDVPGRIGVISDALGGLRKCLSVSSARTWSAVRTV